jgi:hypothetical protein
MSLSRVRSLLLAVSPLVAAAGCGPHALTAEVLPPRTSITCGAPAVTSSTLGRGLFDADATVDHHGSYVVDLRLSAFGANARVDGVEVDYVLPEGASQAVKDAAEKAKGAVAAGDAVLSGDDDDVRQAVLENVQLVPRDLALALAADTELALSDKEFAEITVNITPVSSDGTLASESTSFALDVCKGCLVAEPECATGAVQTNSVCRVGQDVALTFTCPAIVAP